MTVYEIITDKIIASLEGGIIPWQKPWTTMMPANFVSRKAYRGINPFLLSVENRKSRYWLSYKQMVALGGHLKDNDKKATAVIFWTFLEGKEKEDGEKETFPMLRYYNVFNLDQVEGIDIPDEQQLLFTPIERADTVVAGYKNPPPINHEGSRACYSPPLDTIYMPLKETFTSVENYYSTLFHEMVHSTGHKSRLGRYEVTDPSIGFGSEIYSKEELTAEIGSSFLCAETGIQRTDLDKNTTAYIQNWLQVLRGDKKFVVMASAKAQKAVDWILDRKFEKGGANE